MSANKDFRINVRVTNANIQRSIEGIGYDSVPKWCREFGYPYTTLVTYISLKKAPVGKDGEILPSAQRLCDLLGESFDSLFSEHQRDALATNKASIDVSFEDIAPMLTSDGSELLEHVFEKEKSQAVSKALDALPARRAAVLRMRYGVDGNSGDPMTLHEIADSLGVGTERVRQLQLDAERKLRCNKKAREILDAVMVDA